MYVAGLKPYISLSRDRHSTNWATTVVHAYVYIVNGCLSPVVCLSING